MENKFEKIKKEAHKTSLTRDEFSSMRKVLASFMKEHPLVLPHEVNHLTRRIDIEWMMFLRPALSALLIIALVGVGTSFAAEGTVPGDLLYPIKVHVTEPIRGVAAISGSAKASWDTEVASRRLEEMSKLASKGSLDSDTRVELESAIELRTGEVEKRVESLQKENDLETAAEVSSELEVTLRVHEQVLSQIAEDNENIRTEITPAVAKIRNAADSANKIRSSIDSRIAAKFDDVTKVKAEAKLKKTEAKVKKAEKSLAEDNRRENASIVAVSAPEGEASSSQKAAPTLMMASTIETFAPPVSELEQKIKTGKERLDAGAYGEAFVIFGDANQKVDEEKKVRDLSQKLKIKIRKRSDVRSNFEPEASSSVKTNVSSKKSGETDITTSSSKKNADSDKEDAKSESKSEQETNVRSSIKTHSNATSSDDLLKVETEVKTNIDVEI